MLVSFSALFSILKCTYYSQNYASIIYLSQPHSSPLFCLQHFVEWATHLVANSECCKNKATSSSACFTCRKHLAAGALSPTFKHFLLLRRMSPRFERPMVTLCFVPTSAAIQSCKALGLYRLNLQITFFHLRCELGSRVLQHSHKDLEEHANFKEKNNQEG